MNSQHHTPVMFCSEDLLLCQCWFGAPSSSRRVTSASQQHPPVLTAAWWGAAQMGNSVPNKPLQQPGPPCDTRLHPPPRAVGSSHGLCSPLPCGVRSHQPHLSQMVGKGVTGRVLGAGAIAEGWGCKLQLEPSSRWTEGTHHICLKTEQGGELICVCTDCRDPGVQESSESSARHRRNARKQTSSDPGRRGRSPASPPARTPHRPPGKRPLPIQSTPNPHRGSGTAAAGTGTARLQPPLMSGFSRG